MLCYPAFQVDSAPRVGALEVDLSILILGVSIGHRSSVNDVFGIAVT